MRFVSLVIIISLSACGAYDPPLDIPPEPVERARFEADPSGLTLRDRATGTLVRLAHLSPGEQHDDHIGDGRLSLLSLERAGETIIECPPGVISCGTLPRMSAGWEPLLERLTEPCHWLRGLPSERRV